MNEPITSIISRWLAINELMSCAAHMTLLFPWVWHDAGQGTNANIGQPQPTTPMRRAATIFTIALCWTTTVMAQSQATIDKAAEHAHSCVLMSDSMSIALGLTEEQMILVKDADMRGLKACEQAGYRTTGQLDEEAMRHHATDMKAILTGEQYERWSAMCPEGQALGNPPQPSE